MNFLKFIVNSIVVALLLIVYFMFFGYYVYDPSIISFLCCSVVGYICLAIAYWFLGIFK